MFIKQWPTFETVALWVLTALIVLAPILFLPVSGLIVDVGKTFILSLGIVAVLILWLISLLQESRLGLPATVAWLAPLPLLLVLFISALFSGTIRHSLLGGGYEHDTVWFWLLLSLVFWLSAIIFQTKERVIRVCLGLLASGVVVFLFQIIVVLFGPFDLLGIFSNKTVNLIGRWNELSIFFGLIAILAVGIWELVPPKGSKFISYLVVGSLTVSLVVLAFVNFYRTWLVLGVLSLALFVYLVVVRERSPEAASGRRRIARPAFVVLIIALVFLTIGRPESLIGRGLSWVNTGLGISTIEVWPTEAATWQVFKRSIMVDPLLGAGPNNFNLRWLAFKPAGVNESPFWALDFNGGSGYLPSFFITAGSLGLLGVLFLLGSWLFGVVRSIWGTGGTDRSGHSLALVVFLAALYGASFTLIYVPGSALLVIAAALAGITLGVLTTIKRLPLYQISLVSDPRINFISILAVIFSLILSIGAGYFLIQKIVSIYYYQEGLAVIQAGQSVEAAEPYFLTAVSWSDDETYRRVLVDAGLAKIGVLLSTNQGTPETLRTQFENLLASTLTSANRALDLNRFNFSNWLALARVYESLVPLKVPGAYDEAVKVYSEAAKYNPTSPVIDVLRARLELAVNDRKQAYTHLLNAVSISLLAIIYREQAGLYSLT